MGVVSFPILRAALALARLPALASVIAFPACAQAPITPSNMVPAPLGGARVTGQVASIVGPTLLLALRNGHTMAINLRPAEARGNVPQIYPGEFLQVQGSRTGQGKMSAVAVIRAKSAPARWSADIP